ncbi:MAG TPA: permease [Acidimicrobiales bacterium]|nr:permease [Acidimicrobiales bacterium]
MNTSIRVDATTGLVARLALGAVAWVAAYAVNERMWDPLLGDVVGLDLDSRLGDAVSFFFYDTVKILLLVGGLVFVVGMLRTTVSPERVRAVLLGRRALTGFVLAAVLGAVTPFCSCSSIPLFIGFVAAGVPLAVTLTFLIASPLVNEVAVVMLAGLFGWDIAALYVVAGLTMAVGAGLVLSRFDLDRWVEPFVFATPVGALVADGHRPTLAERVEAATDETREILAKVWLWVLVSIAIGAGIHGWVPADFFAEHAGPDNPLAVPLATVLGVPLYSNAAGVIPLAEALWTKGMGLGTVMAFMMSVVALSLPSLILLRRVLMTPLIVLFTAIVTVGILVIGLLFNLVA